MLKAGGGTFRRAPALPGTVVLETAAWVAIFFLMFGMFLILLEVFNPGFFIAVPGGTLIFMGGIGLVWPEMMFGGAAWILWPASAAVAAVANLWLYKMWAPPGKAPQTMAADSLLGQVGTVAREVVPDELVGKVRIKGTVWSARSAAPIPAGTEVRVVGAEGVHIVVEPVPPKT